MFNVLLQVILNFKSKTNKIVPQATKPFQYREYVHSTIVKLKFQVKKNFKQFSFESFHVVRQLIL